MALEVVPPPPMPLEVVPVPLDAAPGIIVPSCAGAIGLVEHAATVKRTEANKNKLRDTKYASFLTLARVLGAGQAWRMGEAATLPNAGPE
jgi:hypothetical protein